MDIAPLQTLNEFAVIALAVAAAYLVTVWLAMLGVRAFLHFRESRLYGLSLSNGHRFGPKR